MHLQGGFRLGKRIALYPCIPACLECAGNRSPDTRRQERPSKQRRDGARGDARTLHSPFRRLHVAALGAHVGQHVVQPAPFFIGELVGKVAAAIGERPRLTRCGTCRSVTQ